MARTAAKGPWHRRCLVKGCPEYGKWEHSADPFPGPASPRNHYNLYHATAAEAAYQATLPTTRERPTEQVPLP